MKAVALICCCPSQEVLLNCVNEAELVLNTSDQKAEPKAWASFCYVRATLRTLNGSVRIHSLIPKPLEPHSPSRCIP